jgi:hypothetical protein
MTPNALAPRRRSRTISSMRTLLIAALLLGSGACRGDSGESKDKPSNGLDAEMKGWRDRMCACASKICTETAMQEYVLWKRSKREAARALPRDDRKVLSRLERDLKDCRMTVLGGGGKIEPKTDEAADDDKLSDPPAAK